MSYSFSVVADTKSEAFAKVEAELAKVVESQPIHAKDKGPAEEAAGAFIATLKEPGEGEQVSVSMSGSLSWQGDNVIIGASVNISTYVSSKS